MISKFHRVLDPLDVEILSGLLTKRGLPSKTARHLLNPIATKH